MAPSLPSSSAVGPPARTDRRQRNRSWRRPTCSSASRRGLGRRRDELPGTSRTANLDDLERATASLRNPRVRGSRQRGTRRHLTAPSGRGRQTVDDQARAWRGEARRARARRPRAARDPAGRAKECGEEARDTSRNWPRRPNPWRVITYNANYLGCCKRDGCVTTWSASSGHGGRVGMARSSARVVRARSCDRVEHGRVQDQLRGGDHRFPARRGYLSREEPGHAALQVAAAVKGVASSESLRTKVPFFIARRLVCARFRVSARSSSGLRPPAPSRLAARDPSSPRRLPTACDDARAAAAPRALATDHDGPRSTPRGSCDASRGSSRRPARTRPQARRGESGDVAGGRRARRRFGVWPRPPRRRRRWPHRLFLHAPQRFAHIVSSKRAAASLPPVPLRLSRGSARAHRRTRGRLPRRHRRSLVVSQPEVLPHDVARVRSSPAGGRAGDGAVQGGAEAVDVGPRSCRAAAFYYVLERRVAGTR